MKETCSNSAPSKCMQQFHLPLKMVLLALLFASVSTATAQSIVPGFDKSEFREMMLISVRTASIEDYAENFPEPEHHTMIYQSKPIGLDNLWDLWTDDQNQSAVISIRGTTEKPESWLANFYAAMVPAKGTLNIDPDFSFTYQLANDPKAAVHVGWLLSTAYLSREIVPRIKTLYAEGTKDFLIIGHSQGGAISYLLTAYLYHLRANGLLPADIRFKTYSSAAPKPGNLYFAYEYEAMTQGGWAFNVVNAADWVPEVPVSIQTLKDFNKINPFVHARSIIKSQKFPAKLVLKHIYRKLDKPTRQAQKNYEKYLGNLASSVIKKNIPGYTPPAYYNSNDYVRTGVTIVLMPDESYYKEFPDDSTKLFRHHVHGPYLYLLDKLQDQNTAANTLFDATWELEYMSGLRIAFEGLFPQQKPQIRFNRQTHKAEGTDSCNGYAAPYQIQGNQITFGEPDPTTMRYCGEGEKQFLKMMEKVNKYQTDAEGKLSLLLDGVPVMRFKKING